MFQLPDISPIILENDYEELVNSNVDDEACVI